MSYILDALRRAERERNLGEVPNLGNGHGPLAPSRRTFWGWLAAAVLTINAGGLLVLIQQSNDAVLRTESSQDAAPDEVRSVSSAPQSTVESTAAAPAPESDPVEVETSSPAPRPPGDAPELVTDSVTPQSEGLPPTLASSESDRHAPLLTSLPQDFVRSVPELRLDVHVFSDDRVQRFVVLNSRHYREGDYTHEGPRLDIITEDGAILTYRGHRFLIPVYR